MPSGFAPPEIDGWGDFTRCHMGSRRHSNSDSYPKPREWLCLNLMSTDNGFWAYLTSDKTMEAFRRRLAALEDTVLGTGSES